MKNSQTWFYEGFHRAVLALITRCEKLFTYSLPTCGQNFISTALQHLLVLSEFDPAFENGLTVPVPQAGRRRALAALERGGRARRGAAGHVADAAGRPRRVAGDARGRGRLAGGANRAYQYFLAE